MNQGTIVQCIGAVVDVEFARSEMPKIYDALKMDEIGLTLEVQQQLGDGVVRTIALGSSDGLRRGMTVVNTGNPATNCEIVTNSNSGSPNRAGYQRSARSIPPAKMKITPKIRRIDHATPSSNSTRTG